MKISKATIDTLLGVEVMVGKYMTGPMMAYLDKVWGTLTWDEPTNAYVVTSKEKEEGKDAPWVRFTADQVWQLLIANHVEPESMPLLCIRY